MALILSRAELGMPSLPPTVVLDFAEQVPVERKARCLEGCNCINLAMQRIS